jgi:predicted RNA polymerase sigma factor
MVEGPLAGLNAVEALAGDSRLSNGHRLDAARGHLLERSGDHAAAIVCYGNAASRTTSTAERNYLLIRAARLRE